MKDPASAAPPPATAQGQRPGLPMSPLATLPDKTARMGHSDLVRVPGGFIHVWAKGLPAEEEGEKDAAVVAQRIDEKGAYIGPPKLLAKPTHSVAPLVADAAGGVLWVVWNDVDRYPADPSWIRAMPVALDLSAGGAPITVRSMTGWAGATLAVLAGDSGDAMVIHAGGDLAAYRRAKKKGGRPADDQDEQNKVCTAVRLSPEGHLAESVVMEATVNTQVPSAIRVDEGGEAGEDWNDVLGWAWTPLGFVGIGKTQADGTPRCLVFAPRGTSEVSEQMCPRLAALPEQRVYAAGSALFSLFGAPYLSDNMMLFLADKGGQTKTGHPLKKGRRLKDRKPTESEIASKLTAATLACEGEQLSLKLRWASGEFVVKSGELRTTLVLPHPLIKLINSQKKSPATSIHVERLSPYDELWIGGNLLFFKDTKGDSSLKRFACGATGQLSEVH